MNSGERRRYPRQETEIAVTVHKKGEVFPATLVDIGQGGVSLISEAGFFPGTDVDITVKDVQGRPIHANVKWSQILTREGKTLYRTGLAADQMLVVEDILKAGVPGKGKQ